MNESPFRTFIELINFDRAVITLQDQLKTLEKELTALQEQQQQNSAHLETAHRHYINAKKAVDACELEVRSLDQKIADKQVRLENVTNHKEYQSVKLEVDALKAKQHELEKVLMESWHALETATKSYEQQQVTFDANQAAVGGLLEATQQKIALLTHQIADTVKQRPEKEKNVPQEWLEKYAAMRTRVADPVVVVQNGICSACFYKVSDQDLLALARNKMLQCKDCYRFLYIESADRATQE